MQLIEKPKNVVTYRTNTWHYRLTRYALGGLAEMICRACPYWMFLVPAAVLAGAMRYVATLTFWVTLRTIATIGYYPWVTLGWLFGRKPRYWRGLTQSVWARDGESLYLKAWEVNRKLWKHCYDRGARESLVTKLTPIYFIGPLVGLTAFLVYREGVGRSWTDAALSPVWYYLLPASYGLLLVLIALGNGYKNGISPHLMSAYHALCPTIKWVDPTEASGDVEREAA